MFNRLVIFGAFLLCLSLEPLFGQASDIPIECAPTNNTCLCCLPVCPPVCAPGPGGIFLHSNLAPPATLPSGDALDAVSITEGSFANPWRVFARIATSEMVLDVAGGIGSPEPRADFFFFPYLTGRVLSITVTNQSSSVWHGLEIELQSFLGSPSSSFDGLSFGKLHGKKVGTLALYAPPSLLNTPCEKPETFPCSDRFNQLSFDRALDSDGDAVTFTGAALPPGQAATFTFLVTENRYPFDTLFFILLHPQLEGGPPPQ